MGVAPGVTVEHYRVFDCNGMSTGKVVMDAVMKAYERGVDLINLSLGSGSRPFSDGISCPHTESKSLPTLVDQHDVQTHCRALFQRSTARARRL